MQITYLVITALITVHPRARGSRWLAPGLMLVALGVSLASFSFALEAVANGGKRNGMPSFPFFMFAVVGLSASAGDPQFASSRSWPFQCLRYS